MTLRFFEQTIAVLASGSDTDGALGAVEVTTPRGAAPPLHVHRREDEAFYVLDGEYNIFIGDEVVVGTSGTWVFGLRDVPHGYRVTSALGRHLSLTMPAGFESFFSEAALLATPSADPRSVMGPLAAVAARYGVELIGPPRTHP